MATGTLSRTESGTYISKGAIRYDSGVVSSVERSDEGFLIVRGVATRTGVFPYRNPDGTMRWELRHPDDVLRADSLKTLRGKPITLEHPPGLVTKKTSGQYSTGSVGSEMPTIIPDAVSRNDLIEVLLNIHRDDAIDDIESGRKRQLSAGYRCDVEEESGVYNGQAYTHRQRNIVYNHMAIVARARAGDVAALRMDGAEIQDFAVQDCECKWDLTNVNSGVSSITSEKRMANITIGSATYDSIPEGAAVAIDQKLTRLDELEEFLASQEVNIGTLQARIDDLEGETESLTEERDREQGRAFGLEAELEEAQFELDRLKGEHTDSAPKFDEAELETRIQAAVTERVDAIENAKTLVETLKSKGFEVPEIKFDSAMTPAAIQKAVVVAMNPGSEIQDDEVKGFYKALASGQARNDSVSTFHADLLETAVSAAKRTDGKAPKFATPEEERAERSRKRMDNCKQPLALSKAKM